MEVYILAAILALTAMCWSLWKRRNYPPGPFGLPLIGNVLTIRNKPPLRLMELGKKYGPIFSVKLGGQLLIVLDDPTIMKEAFAMECFLRRPSHLAFSIPSGGKYGIAFSDGDTWKEQRSFAVQQLTGLGVRSDAMADSILYEVSELCDWMSGKGGAAFSLNRKLQLYVLNSLWNIVGGVRFQPDDPYLIKMMDQQDKVIQETLAGALVFAFPNLAQRFPKLLGWDKLQSALKPLKNFLSAQIQNHIAAGENSNPDDEVDFIDKYLKKIRETNDPSSSFYGDAGWKSLSASLMDLYGAGSETTSAALTWSVLFLCTHQDAQDRLSQEITDVIGRDGRPSFMYKSRMPYTQAVILEVLRCASLPDLTLFRESYQDVMFRGYLIPKGAYLTGNLYSIHHSPAIWGEDAMKFRPDRFLSSDGLRVERNESHLVFGSRGRRCIGEGWSLDVMFLFLSEIFRRFHIFPVDNPSLEPVFGFLPAPTPFKIRVEKRR